MVITEDQWKQLNEQISIIVLRLDRMHEHMVDNINRLEKKMDNGKVKEMMEMETKPENAIIHLQDSVECFDRLLKKSDSIRDAVLDFHKSIALIEVKVDRLSRLIFARSAEEIEKVILEFPLDERKAMVDEMMQTLNQKFGLNTETR